MNFMLKDPLISASGATANENMIYRKFFKGSLTNKRRSGDPSWQ